MSDYIEILDLVIEASIGAYAWEKQNTQRLHIDLQIYADSQLPGKTDQLQDAIDYTQVAQQVCSVASTRHFTLVESMAEEMAARILEQTRIEKIVLRITKPGAVLGAKAIALSITRAR